MSDAEKQSLFKPLSKDEKEVCARFAGCRRFSGMNQEKFAAVLSASRPQIANVESGRSPLKFKLGWKACKELDVNPLWLAIGAYDRQGFIGINVDFVGYKITDRSLFSETCKGPLLADLKYHSELSPAKRVGARAGELREAKAKALAATVLRFLQELPELEQNFLIAELNWAASQFMASKEKGKKKKITC